MIVCQESLFQLLVTTVIVNFEWIVTPGDLFIFFLKQTDVSKLVNDFAPRVSDVAYGSLVLCLYIHFKFVFEEECDYPTYNCKYELSLYFLFTFTLH